MEKIGQPRRSAPSPENDDAFNRFWSRNTTHWNRISRHTRGETSFLELKSEAWLMVQDWTLDGHATNLDDAEDEKRLISHLYQKLVRYTELNVRHAVRLDHAPGGDEEQSHPLMNMLRANEAYDPVAALMQAEEQAGVSQDIDLSPHQSLAAAYVQLLRHFDNRMHAVADHLLISLSYCYQRCAHARRLAALQQPLPATVSTADGAFLPGAWRRFRTQRRAPVQLSFEFLEAEPLLLATETQYTV